MRTRCLMRTVWLAAGLAATPLACADNAAPLRPADGRTAYDERQAGRACAPLPLLALSDEVPVETHYDAARGELRLFYPMQFNDLTEGWNWHPEALAAGEDYYTYKYLPIGSRTAEHGIEVANDAFGSHRYPVRWRHDYFLAFDNPYDFYARDAAEQSGFSAVLTLPAAAAQALLELPPRLAVQLRLRPDRCLSDSTTFWEATLSQPVKFTLKKHYLIGRLEAVVFYAADSGAVLARLPAAVPPAPTFR